MCVPLKQLCDHKEDYKLEWGYIVYIMKIKASVCLVLFAWCYWSTSWNLKLSTSCFKSHTTRSQEHAMTSCLKSHTTRFQEHAMTSCFKSYTTRSQEHAMTSCFRSHTVRSEEQALLQNIGMLMVVKNLRSCNIESFAWTMIGGVNIYLMLPTYLKFWFHASKIEGRALWVDFRSNQLWTLCSLCDLCCPISMFRVLKDVFHMGNAGFLCIWDTYVCLLSVIQHHSRVFPLLPEMWQKLRMQMLVCLKF
jgi:hypothetical protein